MNDKASKTTILKTVPWVIGSAFAIVVAFSAFTISTLHSPISASDNANLYVELLNRGMSIRLLQIVNGLVLGFACVYLGFAMCWASVLGAVEIDAAHNESKLTFRSPSTGAFVVFCGVILLGLAMNSRGIDVKAPTTITTGTESSSGSKEVTLQVPESVSF